MLLSEESLAKRTRAHRHREAREISTMAIFRHRLKYEGRSLGALCWLTGWADFDNTAGESDYHSVPSTLFPRRCIQITQETGVTPDVS